MESEKKKGQGQGSMKKEKKEEEKKEGMGWRKKGRPLFFFFFPFSFPFFPSSCFDAIPSLPFAFPLCPLYSVREISRSSASSHSVFFEHTFLLWAKFNLPFSIPGKWRTVVRNTLRVQGTMQRPKILFVICFILYRSSFMQILISLIIWNSLT